MVRVTRFIRQCTPVSLWGWYETNQDFNIRKPLGYPISTSGELWLDYISEKAERLSNKASKLLNRVKGWIKPKPKFIEVGGVKILMTKVSWYKRLLVVWRKMWYKVKSK